MRIEIYNATRNIRIVPKVDVNGPKADPMDALRELAAYMPESGMQNVEFQCDQAFFDKTGLEEHSFAGIPIIVGE